VVDKERSSDGRTKFAIAATKKPLRKAGNQQGSCLGVSFLDSCFPYLFKLFFSWRIVTAGAPGMAAADAPDSLGRAA
jgi:hypothetical protein